MDPPPGKKVQKLGFGLTLTPRWRTIQQNLKFFNFLVKFNKKLTPLPPKVKNGPPTWEKVTFFPKTWVWVDVDATMADYNFWLFSKIWNFWFFGGKFWYKKLTLRWKFRKKCTPRGENFGKNAPPEVKIEKNAPPEVKISKKQTPLRWFFVHKLAFGLTLMPRWRTTTFDYSAKFEIFDFFWEILIKKLTLRWKFRKKCTPRGENWRKFTPLGENFKKWWFFFKNLRLGWRWRHDGGLFSKIWNISIFSGNFEKKTDPGGENWKKCTPRGENF